MKKKVKAPIQDVPIDMAPDVPKKTAQHKVKVLQQANNPQWVYAMDPNGMGRLPVVIPRRLTGKLVGKHILIEAISDSTGTTHRYVEGQPH
jgi:hypothetical protein